MADLGATERRRRNRAMPPALYRFPVGCLAVVLVYVGVSTALFVATRSILFVALALPGLIVLGYQALRRLRARQLLAEVRRTCAPRGVRCLIIYSNSPLWEGHVKTHWLPRLGPMADILNWSERAAWQESLAVRVFRQFCFELPRRNFNPAIIVFRGLDDPFVFRFFYAFHEAKEGRPLYLNLLESQAFEALGVPAEQPGTSLTERPGT
jgi:hypothetical protein